MSEPAETPYQSPGSHQNGGGRQADHGRFSTGTVLFVGGVVTAVLLSNSFDVDTDPPWKLTEVVGCLIFIAAVATALFGLLLIAVRLFDKE